MQLKTSLFNRGIGIQDIKNVGWIGVVYILVLFFSVPLQILMIYTRSDDYYSHYIFNENLFRVGEEFQIIFMFTVPVLLGIFLFRYLQVKLSADYIHSLPIKREALYHQHVLVGLLILIIPVLINGLILLVMSTIIEGVELLSIASISSWMGTTLLIIIFVFMATVFVGMFTGMSVLQGVLTYILLIFPAGVTVLFLMNVKFYLYGFSVDYYLSNKLEEIILFIRASELSYKPLEGKEVIILILFIVALDLVALFVYLRRKVETATQAIAFRPLQPVFLYGVTFCTMLLGGLYFGETQDSIRWLIFGYVFASIIGYFVALMILKKTWRVLTKWKGFGIFVISMCLIAFLIEIDVTGYEKRTPAFDSIERVYFADSFYAMNQESYYIHPSVAYPTSYYYEEEANKERILALHKVILANKDVYEKTDRFYRGVAFGYELANGKKLVRYYRVPDTFYDDQKDLYGPIIESDEHKRNTNAVLKIEDISEIDKITINSHRGLKSVTITDREDLESFHTVLQTEVKDASYEEIMSVNGAWANVEYLMSSDQRVHTNWQKSYDRIEAWLKERDLLSEARVTADDIAFAIVVKNDKQWLHEYEKTVNVNGEEFKDRVDGLRIEDSRELEQTLRVSSWNDKGDYAIAYYFENNLSSPVFESISKKHAPAFIKEKLN